MSEQKVSERIELKQCPFCGGIEIGKDGWDCGTFKINPLNNSGATYHRTARCFERITMQAQKDRDEALSQLSAAEAKCRELEGEKSKLVGENDLLWEDSKSHELMIYDLRVNCAALEAKLKALTSGESNDKS